MGIRTSRPSYRELSAFPKVLHFFFENLQEKLWWPSKTSRPPSKRSNDLRKRRGVLRNSPTRLSTEPTRPVFDCSPAKSETGRLVRQTAVPAINRPPRNPRRVASTDSEAVFGFRQSSQYSRRLVSVLIACSRPGWTGGLQTPTNRLGMFAPPCEPSRLVSASRQAVEQPEPTAKNARRVVSIFPSPGSELSRDRH
jgi:hypothetical protein